MLHLLKRIGAILLALVLIASFAACAQSPTTVDPEALAFESYSQILQQMSVSPGQSGAFDIDFIMVMDMIFEDDTMHSVSTGNMTAVVDGDTMRTSMVMETDMGALGSMLLEIYMAVEGTTVTAMYMAIDGEEFPTDFLTPELLDEMLENAVNMPDVDEEAFLSVEMEEIDGNTVLHIVLDGQMLMDFALATMGDALGDLGFEMDLTIGDMPMTIVLDSDGSPLSMTMDMTMEMVIDGEEMISHSVSTFTFNAFGDGVEIVSFV